MINNTGSCIYSVSPFEFRHGLCSCYKKLIPYSYLGNNGVFIMCRSWFDYCMAADQDIIKSAMIESLRRIYPEHNNDQVEHGFRPDRSEKLHFIITDYLFHLYVSVKPSYFLRYVEKPGFDITSSFFNWYSSDATIGKMAHNFGKKMSSVMGHNVSQIENYIIRKKGRLCVKSYNLIMDEFLTKINKHETV